MVEPSYLSDFSQVNRPRVTECRVSIVPGEWRLARDMPDERRGPAHPGNCPELDLPRPTQMLRVRSLTSGLVDAENSLVGFSAQPRPNAPPR